ncbi:MAG: pilus assembly protein PilP [Betaproteobacteria bacterium]|nr:pilus assembly protein PilP [Betaproteobacteria bacterium]
MIRACIALSICVLLWGCGTDEYEDLKQFVADAGNNMRGRVEPLPEVKPYEPFTYDAFDLQDPFKPRKPENADKNAGERPAQASELRRKEALEAYPLESLKMVGTLEDKNKKMYALIKTPENNLYQIRVGNYLGQNFGIVTMITETSVTLKEVFQDASGVWSERTSSLQLLDEEESKQ